MKAPRKGHGLRPAAAIFDGYPPNRGDRDGQRAQIVTPVQQPHLDPEHDQDQRDNYRKDRDLTKHRVLPPRDRSEKTREGPDD
jgi:hypothetical protein